MAWPAKDGSVHHSASRASLHDEMNEGKSSKPAGGSKPAPKGDGKPAEKDGSTDVSHMDVKAVVAKHGPAHQITMHHDHSEGGVHTVTSHHGEKGKAHVHHSEHGSTEEAHDHAQMAAGMKGGTEEEESETPGEEMAEQEEQQEPQPTSAGIPGIKS